jgi:hypothetical protein
VFRYCSRGDAGGAVRVEGIAAAQEAYRLPGMRLTSSGLAYS